jgi:hypothetical protein
VGKEPKISEASKQASGMDKKPRGAQDRGGIYISLGVTEHNLVKSWMADVWMFKFRLKENRGEGRDRDSGGQARNFGKPPLSVLVP